MSLAENWRPDLLIYDPFQGAIPLVAAVTGTQAVEHQSGITDGRVLSRMLAAHLADLYEQYGVSGPPAVPSVEVAPPSLRQPDPDSLPTRYVSPHGSAMMPLDLCRPPSRSRVVVSLGTRLGADTQDSWLSALLPAFSGVDAEFLLPAASTDRRLSDALPGNVRLMPWAPLAELLRHCDGIIHHGGAGTLLTAVAAGVPQLIVPHAGDQFFNARVACERGFGLAVDSVDHIDSSLINRMLTGDSIVWAAALLRDENAALPPPAALILRFEELVGKREER